MDLDDRARDALKQEVVASLNSFRALLQREQASYKMWKAAVVAWETSHRSKHTEFATSQHEAISRETLREAGVRFNVRGATVPAECPGFQASSLQKVAEVAPAMMEHEVLRLNICDLSKYGQSHSRMLQDFQNFVSEELRAAPESSCFIVLPPHSTRWGETMDAVDARDELIEKARVEAFRTLTEASLGVLAVECVVLLDKASVAENSSRSLPIHFLMILSSARKTDGTTLKSLFAKSNLFKHRAVPTLVPCMQRKLYRNWAHEVEAADKGALGHLERNFWNSGRALFQALFRSIFAGMKLTPKDRCHIRDWSLWDDEPACAVMESYQTASASCPDLYYSGVVLVRGSEGESRRRAATIAAEVSCAIKEELHHQIESDQYKVPGFQIQKVTALNLTDAPGRPKFECELKVTALRADNSLAVLQSVVDKHAKAIQEVADKDLEGALSTIISEHNKEYNASSQNYTEQHKRSHEHGPGMPDPIEAAGGASAVPLGPASADDAKNADELKASGKVRILEGKDLFYENVFSESGDWYLQVNADGVISKDTRLATIKGKFRTGAKAAALDTEQLFRFKFESDADLTFVSVEGELPVSFPASLLTLRQVFEKLESCGKVRATLVGHKVTSNQSGGYAVVCEDEIALEVRSEPSSKRQTVENVAGLVDIGKIQESTRVQVVPAISYNVKKNKFVPNYPVVFPKATYKVTAGEFAKLA